MKIYMDLTNLMSVNFVTGIQRVVREITVRMIDDKRAELVLMTYSHTKNAFMVLDNQKFKDYFTGGRIEKNKIPVQKYIGFNEIPSGSIFFDIDSVWNSRLKRSFLFPILKQNGVKIVTQVYDLIPITHPQFSHENTAVNFMVYIGANLKYADLIISNANATVDALNELTDRLGIERKKAVVVPLGSDFQGGSKASGEEADEKVKEIANGKYLLMIGTIEPRKNHSLVIDALESGLADKGVKAIFAGRIGWNVDSLEKRIKTHPLYNKNLFFVESPNDATVDYLYKNAFAVAFPTFNEGFGLPVIEAFQRGTPVIGSDIGVVHEVAGDYADFFDPNDKNDLVRCVENLLSDTEGYAKKKERLKEYVPYSWGQSAADMLSAVISVSEDPKTVPDDLKIKQIVMLTARNDDILATLPYIDKFMPFITEMVICCPDKNVDELKQKYNGRLELKFITDSQALAGKSLPEDHAMRNFFLRCIIFSNPIIDDVFIMSDDDYRPLHIIDQDTFVKNGRYQAFYCHDLKEWQGTYGNPTSFDVSMKRTRDFLSANGFPTMMYSSHQMQAIDKRIFNEMVEKYPEITTQGLCDWSAYFNYGIHAYPDMFETVPYVSMGWPGARSDWDLYVQPSEFIFENHYSVLYEKGRVFEGFSEEYYDGIESENMKKVMLFSREIQKQMESREVYRSYCEDYWLQYRELPSFVVVKSNNDQIAVSSPAYFQLKADCWTRVSVTIDRKIIDELNAEKIQLSYWFSDDAGALLSQIAYISVDNNNLSFMLPVKTPPKGERCHFNFVALIEDKDVKTSVSVKTNII